MSASLGTRWSPGPTRAGHLVTLAGPRWSPGHIGRPALVTWSHRPARVGHLVTSAGSCWSPCHIGRPVLVTWSHRPARVGHLVTSTGSCWSPGHLGCLPSAGSAGSAARWTEPSRRWLREGGGRGCVRSSHGASHGTQLRVCPCPALLGNPSNVSTGPDTQQQVLLGKPLFARGVAAHGRTHTFRSPLLSRAASMPIVSVSSAASRSWQQL